MQTPPATNTPKTVVMHSIDFITNLPQSQNKTVIVVIVDQFSKPLCLIPLPGLPSAIELTEMVFEHVFQYYGIHEDIVRDRVVQFTSCFWKGFMEKLGVLVSLTSS